MIIFSSADMEASRGAIHKATRETPLHEQTSPYSKTPARKAADRIGAQVAGTLRKYPIYVASAGVLLGFVLGAFSDVRRSKRS